MPFTRQRERWLEAECINVCDGKVYRLALSQNTKLDKAIPQTFGYVLRLYPLPSRIQVPGTRWQTMFRSYAGSFAAHVCDGWQVPICRQRDGQRWEQGEDLSLTTFSPVEYSASGKMTVADTILVEEMAKRPMREMMRKTGLSQHTLEAIRDRKAVRSRTLAILKQS